MTPKEKAKELYEKFSLYTSTGDEEDNFGEYKKANNYFCKNACLLCVDEIIKANPAIPKTVKGTARNNFTLQLAIESQVPYWQQVKEELQKM